MPKVLADLVHSDREFQPVGAATANDRSAKEVVSGGPEILGQPAPVGAKSPIFNQ